MFQREARQRVCEYSDDNSLDFSESNDEPEKSEDDDESESDVDLLEKIHRKHGDGVILNIIGSDIVQIGSQNSVKRKKDKSIKRTR